MGPLPLLPVRLEGICRTWADGLDPRDAYPGIHHVTLARTPGWWEVSHVGMASREQLKLIRDWLDNGVRSTWRPVKLGEGTIRFEHDPMLQPPTTSDVEWDGTTERVSMPTPEPTGPPISLEELLVVVHTRQGCYNHRGRLSRCVHMHQRAFHDGLFRKVRPIVGMTSSRFDDVPNVCSTCSSPHTSSSWLESLPSPARPHRYLMEPASDGRRRCEPGTPHPPSRLQGTGAPSLDRLRPARWTSLSAS